MQRRLRPRAARAAAECTQFRLVQSSHPAQAGPPIQWSTCDLWSVRRPRPTLSSSARIQRVWEFHVKVWANSTSFRRTRLTTVWPPRMFTSVAHRLPMAMAGLPTADRPQPPGPSRQLRCTVDRSRLPPYRCLRNQAHRTAGVRVRRGPARPRSVRRQCRSHSQAVNLRRPLLLPPLRRVLVLVRLCSGAVRKERHGCVPGPTNAINGMSGPTGMYS